MSTHPDHQLAPPGGWHPAPASRIPPLALRGAGLRGAMLARALGLFVKGDPPTVFLVLMRHWRLFRGWFGFAARLMPFGKLDRRDTELAILRVGWLCRCAYSSSTARSSAAWRGSQPGASAPCATFATCCGVSPTRRPIATCWPHS